MNRKAPGFMNTATTGNACKVLKNGSLTVDKAFSIRRPPRNSNSMEGEGNNRKKGNKTKTEEYEQPELSIKQLADLENRLGIDPTFKRDLNSNTITGKQGALGNIIVCDESSMLSCSKLFTMSKRGKQVTGRSLQPFGGLSVILVLDDFQLRAVGGEVLFEGAVYSMLSYEKDRPKVNSPTSQGRELYKLFHLKYLLQYNRAKDLKLRELLEKSRDLDKENPIDDYFLSYLEEITAEKILEEPGFIDAVTGIPGNRERRSLLIMNIEAKAIQEKGKVLMFRKVLKGKAGNFKKDQAKFVDQLYKNPDYKDEMFQYFYPGEKAILQCNLSTSRGLSNGQVCTMVGMKYNSSDKQALYESALNDKSSTDIFVEVDMPDFILFEVDGHTGEEWESDMSLIPGRCVFALPLQCNGKKDRVFSYIYSDGLAAPVSYYQFEYELGSAATAYKIQGETVGFLLAQFNKNPTPALRITLQMLHVLMSRVSYLSCFRLLPLKNGRQSLDYLRDLKTNPLLRVLRFCYDANGHWIATPTIVETRFDEYRVDWRKPDPIAIKKAKLEKKKSTDTNTKTPTMNKAPAFINSKGGIKGNNTKQTAATKTTTNSTPAFIGKGSQKLPKGEKRKRGDGGDSGDTDGDGDGDGGSKSVTGKRKGRNDDDNDGSTSRNNTQGAKGKERGKGKSNSNGNSYMTPPPAIRALSNKSDQVWAIDDPFGNTRFLDFLTPSVRIMREIVQVNAINPQRRARGIAILPPPDDFVISVFSGKHSDLLRASMLGTLDGWLGSDVLDFTMERWVESRPTDFPFLLMLPSSFTDSLEDPDGNNYTNRYKKKRGRHLSNFGKHLKTNSTIAFIARIPGHWFFVAIKDNVLHIFNGFSGRNSSLEAKIQRWWKLEHQQCNAQYTRPLVVDIHNNYGYGQGNDIRQTDGVSCGVSALMHAYYLIVVNRFASAHDFSYDHINDLRCYIGNTICKHGEETGFLGLPFDVAKEKIRQAAGFDDLENNFDVDVDNDDYEVEILPNAVQRKELDVGPLSDSEAAKLPKPDSLLDYLSKK